MIQTFEFSEQEKYVLNTKQIKKIVKTKVVEVMWNRE
jgi:hypothetical protein